MLQSVLYSNCWHGACFTEDKFALYFCAPSILSLDSIYQLQFYHSGAPDYPCFRGLLKQLVNPLSTQLSDRRSSIVKQACQHFYFKIVGS